MRARAPTGVFSCRVATQPPLVRTPENPRMVHSATSSRSLANHITAERARRVRLRRRAPKMVSDPATYQLTAAGARARCERKTAANPERSVTGKWQGLTPIPDPLSPIPSTFS
jgi:hypothetical protein